jgi:hypothetical protein
MEIAKIDARNLTPQQENFIELENLCCLCGTELVFDHVQDLKTLKMKEKAHCPCCKIPLKDQEHSIQ